MIKIIGIVLLCIIWYLIIGAFVSAGLLKWTGEDLDDEDTTLRVTVMILWPAALIYTLITELWYVLSKLPMGAYNLLNKSKKEKEKEKKKKTTAIIQPEYKNIAMTSTEDYPLSIVYSNLGGNAGILEIMEVIDEAADECEKKYGIKVKGVTDIFSGENGRTYIDFVADNGLTYCFEIPIPVKDWRRRRELFCRCDKYRE